LSAVTDCADRLARVVAGVIRQAVEDAGAAGVVLLEAATPEGVLAADWSARSLGSARVWRADAPPEIAADLRATLGALAALPRAEAERATGRTLAARLGALLAHPANKTALLLGRSAPPEPLLPLGDLYASQVAALAGGSSLPDEVRDLADRLGGIEVLDAALMKLFEHRAPAAAALESLPAAAAVELVARLDAARFARTRVGLVPKLGRRTLGVDLFA
jgi:hypothetical protein